MPETRYERPGDDLLAALASEAMDAAGLPARIDGGAWIESGSSHVVMLTDEAAVRISREPRVTAETVRTQRLIDALPELAFEVPRSMGPPVRIDDLVAIATRRLSGAPHPPEPADPGALRSLIDAIHGVPLDTVAEYLAPVRAFAGGDRWYSVMTEEAVPLLPRRLRGRGSAVADDLRALTGEPVTLNHGDLAGSNVLWEEGRVVAVLDWDLAAADDVAEDLASLGGWHGWPTLSAFASPDDLRRAQVFRASFPLQVVCFALTHERPALEIDRAVARAATALEGAPLPAR